VQKVKQAGTLNEGKAKLLGERPWGLGKSFLKGEEETRTRGEQKKGDAFSGGQAEGEPERPQNPRELISPLRDGRGSFKWEQAVGAQPKWVKRRNGEKRS
jgi:hypothetical protein